MSPLSSSSQISSSVFPIPEKSPPQLDYEYPLSPEENAIAPSISRRSASENVPKSAKSEENKQQENAVKGKSIFQGITKSGNKLINNKTEYTIINTINKGGYGTVLKVQNATGNFFAAKFSHPQKISYQTQKHEEKIVSLIAQNIPNASIAALIEGFSIKILSQSKDSLKFRCTIYELLNCNLFEFISEKHPEGCPLPMIHDFTKQLLDNLDSFAKHGIVHADLKPENIAFQNIPSDQNNGQALKIIDFGLSNTVNRLPLSIQSFQYRAPEVILENTPYSPAVDMWSLACLLAAMYTGKHLFNINTPEQQDKNIYLLRRIISVLGNAGMPKSKNRFINENIQDLQRTLPNNLEKSLQLYRMPRNHDDDLFIDMLQRMLILDPNNRIPAEDALKHPFMTSASFATPLNVDDPLVELKSSCSLDSETLAYIERNHVHRSQKHSLVLSSIDGNSFRNF